MNLSDLKGRGYPPSAPDLIEYFIREGERPVKFSEERLRAPLRIRDQEVSWVSGNPDLKIIHAFVGDSVGIIISEANAQVARAYRQQLARLNHGVASIAHDSGFHVRPDGLGGEGGGAVSVNGIHTLETDESHAVYNHVLGAIAIEDSERTELLRKLGVGRSRRVSYPQEIAIWGQSLTRTSLSADLDERTVVMSSIEKSGGEPNLHSSTTTWYPGKTEGDQVGVKSECHNGSSGGSIDSRRVEDNFREFFTGYPPHPELLAIINQMFGWTLS